MTNGRGFRPDVAKGLAIPPYLAPYLGVDFRRGAANADFEWGFHGIPLNVCSQMKKTNRIVAPILVSKQYGKLNWVID